MNAEKILIINLAISGINLIWTYTLSITSYKKSPDYKNRCDCKDVNQCDKWCDAKERFTRDYE